MDRPSLCNELELRSWLERLARDEIALHERIQHRVAELKHDDRPLDGDPSFRRLRYELQNVRVALGAVREACRDRGDGGAF